jgi:hypothetical protein
MTETTMDRAEALELAADFLAECTECGNPHFLLPDPTPHMNRLTWADPDDGHLYYRRGSQTSVEILRAEIRRLRKESDDA